MCQFYLPSQTFSPPDAKFAALCDTIIQHYATLYNPRRYIAAYSPPYRREQSFLATIAVHNLIGI